MRTVHMCQSIRGPLLNWTWNEWNLARKWIKKSDGTKYLTVHELKSAFLDELANGHEVIPLGDECDNFDYKTGCKGHEKKEVLP